MTTLKELQKVIVKAEDAYLELSDAYEKAYGVLMAAYSAYHAERVKLEQEEN
jgi:hypothetical protein|tara:strand:- start:1103 stop:1258 length:156 start_codon:yes stop_codon:yes gene_type:complete